MTPMRTFLAATFAAYALCAGPLAASAAPTQITVTAQGTSTAMPDIAQATFTIATNADAAASATSDNNNRYQRMLTALKGLGIAENDIRTTGFNVSYTPPPRPPARGDAPVVPQQPERYGYFVYRNILVTVRKSPQLGQAIDAAVHAGVTDLGGVSYTVANPSSEYARALNAAVANARAQAETIASAAGLHIVRIRTMQEGAAQPAPVPMMRMAEANVYNAPTQIQPSNVETQATVTITYEAQ
jgi:uncharacterized protein YggE